MSSELKQCLQHTYFTQTFFFPLQEMLDIMKAIYDMMGKCTYPVLKEDAPRQHVETFFQVGWVTQEPKRLLCQQVQKDFHCCKSFAYPTDFVIPFLLCGSTPSFSDLLITPCFFNNKLLKIIPVYHLLSLTIFTAFWLGYSQADI